MITIAEHTIDETLLPAQGAYILDAGCSTREFSKWFSPLHKPFGIDIRWLDSSHQYAITGHIGRVGVVYSKDLQATKIGSGDSIHAVTIEEFSRLVSVEFWDVIKLDIEGSEIDAICAMTKPMAKQITVEFHLHCGQTMEDVQKAVDHLHSLGYRTHQHELSDRHCAGFNYWDSLFYLEGSYIEMKTEFKDLNK